ncbi:MAG: GNAT family N-acetyltransferase [Rubrivivax sp.]|nr:GNAT family N-acetyltransferase [Rubrivivax sp.]
MQALQEQHRVGIHYLEAATALLRRVRRAHPTAGLLEAADLQWWWRTPRSTDDLPQLFWFDEMGRPEAAVIATDWGDAIALDPIVMPDATPDRVAHVVGRGLAHAAECGFARVDVVVDRADAVMREVLVGHGFAIAQDARLSVVEAWLAAQARPGVSPLHAGYRRCSRAQTTGRAHHMVGRSGPGVEARLRQTSLYRPDLDLLVLDAHDGVAAYALFWLDGQTATGLVEPMRTEDGHRRRGLARHLLTAGIRLLAEAGAERIKICFQPDNAAARDLYLGVGFEPVTQSAVFSRARRVTAPGTSRGTARAARRR